MSKVTLTPVQRKAFAEVIATANSTAAESTVKALLRRNLIAPEGDGFAVTKAGRMFIALDDKTDLTSAMVEGRKVAGRKDLPPVKDAEPTVTEIVKDSAAKPAAKTVAKKAADKAAVEHVPNVPGEIETDAPVVEPKAAPKTERLTMVEKPKADKDSTIRVSAQILAYIGTRKIGQAGSPEAVVLAKLAKADLASDKSRRIAVDDADLDALSAIAADMAAVEGAGRGEVRSARALIQWIDGMKARRASKK